MKTWQRVLLGLLVVGLLFFAVLQGFIFSTHARDDSDVEVPTVIILGAKLQGDQPMLSLVYRLEKALAYLERYPDTVAICAGAKGSDELITEAQAMKDWLVSRGISSDRILLEESSTNTYENFYYAKEIMDERGLDNRVAIATNGYHLYRANLLAERLGLDPILLAAKTPWSVIIQSYVREALAILKSYLLDR